MQYVVGKIYILFLTVIYKNLFETSALYFKQINLFEENYLFEPNRIYLKKIKFISDNFCKW